jgi:hypothetical protein
MRLEAEQISFCQERVGAIAGPLTQGQRGRWEYEQNIEPYHNLVVSFKIRDDYELASIRRSFRNVVERYEAIRTSYRFDRDGHIEQFLLTEGSFPLLIFDAASPKENGEREYIDAFFGDVFDFDRGIPLRACIALENGKPHELSLVVSELNADGMSVPILARALIRELEARADPKAAKLAVHPLDQLYWEQSDRGRAAHARSLEYWQSQLALFPSLASAITAAEKTSASLCGMRLHSTVMGSEILALAARYRISPTSVIIAATATALSSTLGTDALSAMFLCHNRFRAGTESAVGNFVQGVPLYIQMALGDFRSFAMDVHKNALLSYLNGQHSVGDVLQHVKQRERATANRLHVDVEFNIRLADTPASMEHLNDAAILQHQPEISIIPTIELTGRHPYCDVGTYILCRDASQIDLLADSAWFKHEDIGATLRKVIQVVHSAARLDP